MLNKIISVFLLLTCYLVQASQMIRSLDKCREIGFELWGPAEVLLVLVSPVFIVPLLIRANQWALETLLGKRTVFDEMYGIPRQR